MPKHAWFIRLLKWLGLLFALFLLVEIVSFSGIPPVAQAAGAKATCSLLYVDKPTNPLHEGNTVLDVSKVPNTSGLQATLKKNYSLNCDAPHSSCQLVVGAGDTTLDKSNIQASPYLKNGLAKYNLKCKNATAQAGLITGGKCHLTYAANATPAGNTKLVVTFVPNNNGLQTTLKKNYVLNCDKAHASCTLISGKGTTTLDKSNISPTASSYIYNGLKNFNLSCVA